MNKSQKALSTGDMWEHTGCFLGIFSLKERFQRIINFILGPIESKQYFLLDRLGFFNFFIIFGS
jgi:hypothetical protein